jgi:hypothetical protein
LIIAGDYSGISLRFPSASFGAALFPEFMAVMLRRGNPYKNEICRPLPLPRPLWNSPIPARHKESLPMSRTSLVIACVSLLTLSAAAPRPAQARELNRNCRVPSISLCPGCTSDVKITVLQDHECRINYSSMGPMLGQKILVNPKHGKYWADNETSTAYSPSPGYVGSDYFEAEFSYELMNGSKASATLKANVEVVPQPPAK